MSKSPLSARVAIECIDQALVLGKRHFWSLLRLGLIPFLAYSGVTYVFGGRGTPAALRLAVILGAFGIYGLLEAVTVSGAWDLLHGQPVNVGTVWSRVRGRVVSVVVASWLRILIIFLGFFLLIIPGFYFIAILFAVPTVNVVENLGVGASFARSRSLALQSVWGVLLAVGGFLFVAGGVAVLIPRVLMQLGVPHLSVFRPLCSFIWAAVVVPFRAALAARIYLEIRVRSEGYDLQNALASLPSAA